MRQEMLTVCPDCGRPQHKGRKCADVAEREISPLHQPLCDICFRNHSPKVPCSLRSPEEEEAHRSRVVSGMRHYDRDSK
jgi:hypothetical protein